MIDIIMYTVSSRVALFSFSLFVIIYFVFSFLLYFFNFNMLRRSISFHYYSIFIIFCIFNFEGCILDLTAFNFNSLRFLCSSIIFNFFFLSSSFCRRFCSAISFCFLIFSNFSFSNFFLNFSTASCSNFFQQPSYLLFL
eukprot:UN25554